MSVFVDTSVWFAAANRADAGNSRAKSILSAGETLVTSNHVLLETWTLLHHRVHRQAAQRFWDALREGVAEIAVVTAADLESAWQISSGYRDQDFSFADCTSFALMRRLGIERAASFDADFAIYRYGPSRRRAFTILR